MVCLLVLVCRIALDCVIAEDHAGYFARDLCIGCPLQRDSVKMNEVAAHFHASPMPKHSLKQLPHYDTQREGQLLGV